MKKKTSNKATVVPVPTIRRLPLYLSFLKTLRSAENKFISAPDIAKELHIHSTQITKDLSYINVKGKTKIGYEVDILINILQDFLGYHITRKAFIVGVGNLGTALIKYHEFYTEGMDIIAGFDIDSEKLKLNISGVKLQPVEKFKECFEKTKVDIGIITVPAEQAQKTADLMVECGIKAIWNFSATPLSVPDNIIVQNTSIDSALAMIKWKLHQNKPLIYKNRIL